MHCFDTYKHSLAIIFSAIEGQYKGEMIQVTPQTWMLCTPFDYHYVCGDIPDDDDLIITAIKTYVKKYDKKEFILFAPDNLWDDYLMRAFKRINGVIAKRSVFRLNPSRFEDIIQNHTLSHDIRIIDEQMNHSSISYPVAVFKKGQQTIASAKGFMIGNQHVEIDVFTDEAYRHQGLAFESSLVLIKHLLSTGYVPDWHCWKEKIASAELAKKLGFEHQGDIHAYVWVEDFDPII